MEKKGWVTWFTRKTNKTLKQEISTIFIRPLAPTWIGEGAPPWAPSHVGLRSLASKYTWWDFTLQLGILPEMERDREGKREREEVDTGGARFPRNQFQKLVWETGPSFTVRKIFLNLWLYIEFNGWLKKYAASAALTLIVIRLSLCIPSCIHKSWVIYIIF